MSFTCGYCGKTHDGMPMDIAYKRPLTYFTIPESDRPERIEESDDYLIIDKNVYIVRGILCLPVHESEEDLCFGVWASVEEQTFSDIWHAWDCDGTGLVFDGTLDGSIRVFPDTLNVALRIHLQNEGQRPRFIVKDTNSSLGIAQSEGVPMDRVHEIQHEYLGNDA